MLQIKYVCYLTIFTIIMLQIIKYINTNSLKETIINGPIIRKYDPYKQLDITDKRPLIFNQNWNKIWMKPAVAYNNNETVQTVPHSTISLDVPKYDKNTHILTKNEILTTLDKISKKYSLTKNQIKNKYGSFFEIPHKKYGSNFDRQTLTAFNKKTWKTQWKEYDSRKSVFTDFPIPNSPLNSIEHLLQYYIKIYNIVIHSLPSEKIKTKMYGYDKYFISKYYIDNIYQNSSNKYPRAFLYGIVLTITQNVSSPISYTLYIQILQDRSNKKYYIQDGDIVGLQTSDDLLLPNSIPETEKKSYYNLQKLYNPMKPMSNYDISKYLKKRLKSIKERNIDEQYVCFNKNINNNKINNKIIEEGDAILYASSARDCINKFDLYGRPKQSGVWDKPCKKDADCPFYGKNKNYNKVNKLGKCNRGTGYCELPINMKHIGYHYFDKTDENQPMCYNCNAKRWNAITPLGKCCKEQETNKDKYPFLKSADYAFKNDMKDRMNKHREDNCYNLYNGNTGTTELICNNLA